MEQIKLSTGVVDYDVNGKCTISYNPTDYNFIATIYEAFTSMESKDKAWREQLKAEQNPTKVIALYREGDAFIRETIDKILGEGTCNAVFGNTNVLALSEGLPIWLNLMLGIIDTMDETFTKEQNMKNPKVEKYLKKYHR